jgi:hypothetical protein
MLATIGRLRGARPHCWGLAQPCRDWAWLRRVDLEKVEAHNACLGVRSSAALQARAAGDDTVNISVALQIVLQAQGCRTA